MTDVYLYGHVSTGIIVRIQGRYPEPDGYGEIVETLENHCGEATGSALVLARLGASTVLEGNWIGDTPACRGTVAFLESRGIDCSGLVVKPGYQGVNEITISDGASRTVFGRYIDLLFTTPQWEMPDLARIDEAQVVCVDPTFGEATLAVARAAKAAGKPLVTSDAPCDSELAALADVVVISGELMARDFPEALESEQEREALFERYLERCLGLVVFTAGSRPLWYARGRHSAPSPGAVPTGERRELAPFPTRLVDSAGAGDSFRGGLVFGTLRGWSDDDRVRFAAAVAALVCTTAPGCVNPPSLEQVVAVLEQNGIGAPPL
ncbi:MAG: carbohydrate kinase family protein [Gaiellaceae bacterium]|jgi:sugar/nucleoside kinase (ribokinase family)